MNAAGGAEADVAAIRRTTAELLAAVNASDVTRVSAVWATNGILMPPHRPLVQGGAAIREYFRSLFLRGRFRFQFTSSNIEVAGDAAFERVSYTVTAWPANGLGPVEDAGKGLHVYRRQPDGAWNLYCDIWNSDRPEERRP